MPVSSPIVRGGQPSCFDRIKLGFMMGAFVGCGAGVLFGGFASLRAGLRGMELVSQTTKTMFQGAGTFGTFMAIGSGIRC